MHHHVAPRSTPLKQGTFPPMRFCCPHHPQYYVPLRLLTRHRPGFRIDVLMPRLPRGVDPRPREISLVALMALPAFRSPLRRRVLRGCTSRVFASSMAVATHETLGSLLVPLRGLTCRRCRIPFMVRTTRLRSFRRRILRFTTPGRPGAAAACYVALWRLPRPDFHRLVIRTFQGAPFAG